MSAPKLRFKDENGNGYPEWEENSFLDVFTGLNNNTFSRDCLNDERGQVYDVHYGDVLIKYNTILDMNLESVPYINDDINCERYNLLHDGDVIVADTAEDETVGKSVEIQNVDGKSVIAGLHTMAWRPIKEFAPRYLGYYINSYAYHDRLRLYMQGIKVTSVSKANIVLTTINYPVLAEQQKIASFFSTLDQIISDCQSEVDAWERQKKGVMQQLFSQKIRFKDNDGSEYPEWETHKLFEFTERITRKNKNNETDIPLTISSLLGLVDQREYFGKTIASKDMSGYFLLKKGEFAYNKSSSAGFDYGSIKRLDNYEQGAVSTLYICFALTGNLANSDYIAKFFDSNLWNAEAKLICAEGARNHGLLNVSPDDFFNIKVCLPSLAEQQKIASCLSAFDEVIDKSKKELQKYQELKKGLMQQMFV